MNFNRGGRDLGYQIQQLQQSVGEAHRLNRQLGQNFEEERGENARLRQQLERQKNDLNNLAETLQQLTARGSGDPEHVKYIEQIPGRRIPFDLMVEIPIGANVTAAQQASTTISQDGPFVAVARYATFQSSHQFTVTDPNTQNVASFQGRSFGRFRPIHSAWDLNDGNPQYQPVVGQAFPGTGAGIYASPSNHSSFRTMEFDGVIQFQNQGSGFFRQNIRLPSVFYTSQINAPFALGALDFFERGEVLEWNVTPLHANNPGLGNVQSYGAGGFYPFINSQYDVHEGILDPVIAGQQTDPATRLPNGILIIGFHGYRIVQPPGPVTMT